MKIAFMKKARTKEALTCYLFLTPNMFFFVTFFLYAILSAFYYSTTSWSFISPVKEFIGFQNYIDLTQDRYFLKALQNTLKVVAALPIGIVISLSIALVIHSRFIPKFKSVFRVGFFTPQVIAMVAWAMIWNSIYAIDGILNRFLDLFGIIGPNWLASLTWALLAIIAMTIIKGLGYNMVLFLAGLEGIPSLLYDAAKIDGAGRWQQFWYVTLPCLQHTMFFVLAMAIISSFQIFDQIYIMTSGGPLGRTEVLVSYLYYKGFLVWKMGYASAVGCVLFGMIFTIILLQRKLMGSGIEF